MGKTKQELLSSIGSQELTEWSAYENVNGRLGSAKQEVQMAVLSALFANAHRNPKVKAFTVDDFMLSGTEKEKKSSGKAETPEQIRDLFHMMAQAGKGKQKGNG